MNGSNIWKTEEIEYKIKYYLDKFLAYSIIYNL